LKLRDVLIAQMADESRTEGEFPLAMHVAPKDVDTMMAVDRAYVLEHGQVALEVNGTDAANGGRISGTVVKKTRDTQQWGRGRPDPA
jgi:hypothetical protein